ncbi:MAG: ParB N-terminal domain-containing protein [Kiritimatiellae bacterium]|nr:ParB N-terminal domain-containing protein [Kiritimatiellia bacterium]MBR1836187.1 ParB N-terminal domain-containing protein [Kiritimatiellia bacterium]
MQIPIESITVPERVRRDLGDLQPLMDSLKRVGQLNPIVISPAYELIAGHRRLTAASNLGWKTVDATVVSGLDEVRRLEMELEENVYRKDFTPDEVLEGWKKLDRLRHPSAVRRAGRAVRKFFSKLAFWKRRARNAEAALAAAQPPPGADAPAAAEAESDQPDSAG